MAWVRIDVEARRKMAPLALGAAALLGACDRTSERSPADPPVREDGARASASWLTSVAERPTATASGTATAAPSALSPLASAPEASENTSGSCAADMVQVQGEYCPALTQVCDKHHTEFENAKASKTVSERCLSYRPSTCVSKQRRSVKFCMDRYEYPNVVGEIPRVLTSWKSAKKLCEARGKRLCTEDEFNFACEGPSMLPYVYGHERNKQICAIDKEYRYPDHSKVLPEYDECLALDWCKAELTRLDQREPIGQRKTCRSWAGVFDLNGNVNEWVNLPKEKAPNRSGLKGGWWGPVRGRCRPTVTFHKESDYGYEAGFRCCTDS